MSRLPIPGSDDGTWGDILNDYLGVSHNADGTVKSATIADAQVAASAAIAKSKLAALNIGDADVSAISESKVTNLTSDLAAKAPINNPVFTGTVTLPADPLANLQAATKQYVDASASTGSHLVITPVASTGQSTLNGVPQGALVVNNTANDSHGLHIYSRYVRATRALARFATDEPDPQYSGLNSGLTTTPIDPVAIGSSTFTLNVDDASGLADPAASGGSAQCILGSIKETTVTYTGKTATSLTGCTVSLWAQTAVYPIGTKVANQGNKFNASILELVENDAEGKTANIKIIGRNPDIETQSHTQIAPRGKYEIFANAEGNDSGQINGRKDANTGFQKIVTFLRPGQEGGRWGVGFQSPSSLKSRLHVRLDEDAAAWVQGGGYLLFVSSISGNTITCQCGQTGAIPAGAAIRGVSSSPATTIRQPVSTLSNSATLSSAFSVDLVDSSLFPAGGRVTIGSVTIVYTAKSGNTLTGCSVGSESAVTSGTIASGATATLDQITLPASNTAFTLDLVDTAGFAAPGVLWAAGSPQTAAAGLRIEGYAPQTVPYLEIIDSTAAGATTVSNGGSALTLPAANSFFNLPVAAVTGFQTSGTVSAPLVAGGTATVTYFGFDVATKTFVGCRTSSTGQFADGAVVTQAAGSGILLSVTQDGTTQLKGRGTNVLEGYDTAGTQIFAIPSSTTPTRSTFRNGFSAGAGDVSSIFQRAVGGTNTLMSIISGGSTSNPAWAVRADGRMRLGDGTSTPDISIMRTVVGTTPTLQIKDGSAAADVPITSAGITASGASSVSAPVGANATGLAITQSDTTNNPIALKVTQAGTGTAVDVRDSGNNQLLGVPASGRIVLRNGVVAGAGDASSVFERTALSSLALMTIAIGGSTANPPWSVRADGKQLWGDGTSVADITGPYRAAAHQLKIDDQLQVLDGVATKEVNVTGLTSAQIDALFTATPKNGTVISDPTNSLLLVRQNGKWYKTAALTQIA